jgi:hypothetical protein
MGDGGVNEHDDDDENDSGYRYPHPFYGYDWEPAPPPWPREPFVGYDTPVDLLLKIAKEMQTHREIWENALLEEQFIADHPQKVQEALDGRGTLPNGVFPMIKNFYVGYMIKHGLQEKYSTKASHDLSSLMQKWASGEVALDDDASALAVLGAMRNKNFDLIIRRVKAGSLPIYGEVNGRWGKLRGKDLEEAQRDFRRTDWIFLGVGLGSMLLAIGFFFGGLWVASLLLLPFGALFCYASYLSLRHR